MKRNVPLIFSVGLNVVLVAGIGTGLLGRSQGNANSDAQPVAEAGQKLENALRNGGLDAAQSKQLVQDLLVRQETRDPVFDYWHAPAATDATQKIAILERNARVRARLLEEYGAAAKDDPAFAQSFRPYEHQYPMLSSDEQIKLEARNLEQLKQQAGENAPGGLMPVSHRPDDSFEAMLDGDRRFEYLVRASLLAKALSATPIDFTEKEFRAVFGVLAKAQPELVTSATTMSLNAAIADENNRPALVETMGAERYEALRRARDPAYTLLHRLADARGISHENMDKAYALLSTSGAPAGNDAFAAPPEELTKLLGTNAADIYRTYQFTRRGPMAAGAAPTPGVSQLQGKLIMTSPPTSVTSR